MSENDITKIALSFAFLAFSDVLNKQLIEKSKRHDGRDGLWLKQIENEMISGVKKSHSKGLSEDTEFDGMHAAIAIIEGFFVDIRRSLSPSHDA